MFWDINGIFAAQPVSDALALILSVVLVIREKRQLYQMADVSPENTLITE